MKRVCKIAKRIAILSLALFLIVNITQYIYAQILCCQIASNQEIQTSAGDLTTGPYWLDDIFSIMQSEGVKIPLVEACRYRNIQAVQKLLNNGADPNLFIEGRLSPLEAALRNTSAGPIDEKSFLITKMLVEAGCDVNQHASPHSVIEQLATYMVAGNDNQILPQIIVYLLEHGGISLRDDCYSDLLHSAVRSGNVNFAEQLIIDFGYDVNYPGYQGQTALITAILYSEQSATMEMFAMLIEHGADPTISDDTGKNALEYARECGYQQLVTLLGH